MPMSDQLNKNMHLDIEKIYLDNSRACHQLSQMIVEAR